MKRRTPLTTTTSPPGASAAAAAAGTRRRSSSWLRCSGTTRAAMRTLSHSSEPVVTGGSLSCLSPAWLARLVPPISLSMNPRRGHENQKPPRAKKRQSSNQLTLVWKLSEGFSFCLCSFVFLNININVYIYIYHPVRGSGFISSSVTSASPVPCARRPLHGRKPNKTEEVYLWR